MPVFHKRKNKGPGEGAGVSSHSFPMVLGGRRDTEMNTCGQACLSSLEHLPGVISSPGPAQGHRVKKNRILGAVCPIQPFVHKNT